MKELLCCGNCPHDGSDGYKIELEGTGDGMLVFTIICRVCHMNIYDWKMKVADAQLGGGE